MVFRYIMAKPDPNLQAGLLEALRILKERWQYWDAAHACGALDCDRQRHEVWQCYERVRKLTGAPEWNPTPSPMPKGK